MSQLAGPDEDLGKGATAVDFDFDVTGNVELLTTPRLAVDVAPLGQRAFLFAKVSRVSDGEAELVDNQVMPRSIEGSPGETRRVKFDLVSFYREFEAGDTLQLTLATSDTGFNSARQSAGILVEHAESTLSVDAIAGAENLG